MPYLDSGRVEEAIQTFRDNVKALLPYVRKGYDIVVPEPTCGMMLKKNMPITCNGEEGSAMRSGEARLRLSEYLVKLQRRGQARKRISLSMSAGSPTISLATEIPGDRAEVDRTAPAGRGARCFIDKGCSGHDGTWAMKRSIFELAQKVARGLHRGVKVARGHRRYGLFARRDADHAGHGPRDTSPGRSAGPG